MAKLSKPLRLGLKRLALPALLLGVLSSGLALAQTTQIANEPLITAKGSPIKPNLLLLLDDSGSMADAHLPELAGNFGGVRYGYRSRQCNGLAFDSHPDVRFDLPVDYLGNEVAAPSQDGLFAATLGTTDARELLGSVSYAGSGTVDLTLYLPETVTGSSTYRVGDPVTVYDETNTDRWMIGKVTGWTRGSWGKNAVLTVRMDGWSHSGATTISAGRAWVSDSWPLSVHFRYTGLLKPLEFTYTTTGAPNTNDPLYKACRVNMGGSLEADAGGSFTRYLVSAESSDAERQRFANWYVHYRTRQAMLRTIVSLAFRKIDDRFRIGVATIRANEGRETFTSLTSTGRFVHVRDFEAVTPDARGFTQRQKFYTLVSRLPASGYTPNRGALSFAGRYFGNVTSRQDADPVQYACQKNFTLLATDGAWNDENEGANFGPFGMAPAGQTPSSVGDQDGAAANPVRDAFQQADLLADVAYYFRNTDLRDEAWGNCTGALGSRVCDSGTSTQDVNGVPQEVKLDPKQTMTTFTMSLGQFGTLKYASTYGMEGDSSDFQAILNGTKVWPSVADPGNSANSSAAKVDDTWHAAVNGGGRFFNASDPDAVARGLESALDTIRAVTGAGSAAATSTLYPVQDNNFFYVASFTAPAWRGDLRAYTIDTTSGALNVKPTKDENEDDGRLWSSREQLDAMAASDRRILMRESVGSTQLVDFSAARLKDHSAFKDRCATAPLLSQCPVLSAEEKLAASDGSNMVNFLRGQNFPIYREREAKLGDIVNSAPVFDGPNRARYSDPGFAEFASSATIANRKGVLYAGANDGMLHAFDAATGKEIWAFVPSEVIPQMWRLADRNYSGNHRFFVDGPPVLADVKLSSGWRRILVFGLGAGGRSYVALDVTDNQNPTLLWEFKDANLGLTTARPVVTKVKDGRWVVVVPSGYNNVSPGDGKGRLFVLNVEDGGVIKQISTTVGSTGRPSGLGPVTAWVDDVADNTASRFYAGDNEGNLWRFDVDNNVEPFGAALKLASFSLDGEPQPITTRPIVTELSKGGFTTPVVFVGTGRMVGTDDLGNTKTQSIYAVRERLTAEGWSDIRGTSVKQTLVTSGNTRTLSKVNPVDWTTSSGWYVDLDLLPKGERINVPMALQGRTLLAAANIPSPTGSCSQEGGTAWLYALDVDSGELYSETAFIDNSMISGFSPIRLPNGDARLIVTKSNNTHSSEKTRPNVYSNLVPRRANWRELRDR